MFSILRKAQDDAKNQALLARLISLRAGNPRPMAEQDFKDFGARAGIHPVHLHAFFFVESANSGFTEEGRLTICCEPHVRYRNSKQAKKLYRLAPDLFYPRWIDERKVPGKEFHVYRLTQPQRWDNLARAAALDFNAAIMGTSYGAGQQLGEGWKELGFASCLDLIEYLYEGQHAHLDVMVRYLRVHGQIDNLNSGDFAPVVKAYNGSGNVAYYQTRLEAAVAQKGSLYA